MKRCVIIGGADIRNYVRIRSFLGDNDFYIFCDSGLKHQDALGLLPDLIVGDCDSHEKPVTETETIVLPCEKDDTDTVFAVKEALKRGFEEFLIVGAAGGRLDHTLANVSILQMLKQAGKKARMVDDYSEMEMVADEPVFIDDSFAFFSLLNVSGKARGIDIENAKYPLKDAEITCEYQYGVSNEVLKGKKAKVTVSEGSLLLIKIFSQRTDC